jgi:hypothetical protein
MRTSYFEKREARSLRCETREGALAFDKALKPLIFGVLFVLYLKLHLPAYFKLINLSQNFSLKNTN